MAKIETIDRQTCRILANEIENELQVIAEKYGVSIKRGNASFNSNDMTIKIEIATISNGVINSREAEDFKLYGKAFGLKEEWLNKTFKTYSGETIEIIGLKPRSRQYPVLGKKSNGRVFKYNANEVKAFMTKTNQKGGNIG